ncbi:50S ribosomal protein L18 [Shigella flexneri]
MGEACRRTRSGKRHQQCSFDRSGFQFHGRVKALADAAVKLAFSSKVEV